MMHDHNPTGISRGTPDDDLLVATRGSIFGFAGDDVMLGIAQNGFTQIHTYGAEGDDRNIMSFNSITTFSHGHHVRGGVGNDTFSFVDTDRVESTIVGRIEDFDPTQDQILIEGRKLDFNNLPTNVRVVEYNGAYHDVDAVPQQWLLINTAGGGTIFYALEGARIDMTTVDAQEGHFLLQAPDFAALPDVSFEDRENYIPAGYTPWGGAVIEDNDIVRADVEEVITDTVGGDLIAGGLNDDRIMANFGHDHIWGGSGNDFIFSGLGNDTISGGTGDDTLRSGDGADTVYGGSGNDFVDSGAGADFVDGGAGNDELFGMAGHDTLLGGDGDDTIDGGGRSDFIDGGAGRDVMTGGTHIDTFHFQDFDWGFDTVTDYEAGRDKLSFSGAVDSYDDLIFVNYMYDGEQSVLIRFNGADGLFEKGMGGIVLAGVTTQDLSVDDFVF